MKSKGLVILALSLMGLALGCQGGGGYRGSSYGSPAMVSSSILKGTRTKSGSGFLESWDVDISVSVEASGDAIGFQYSTLWVRGDGIIAEDSTPWLNINWDGWPSSFTARARYIPGYGDSGTVHVTVECDDFGHPNFGDLLYSADHAISWSRQGTDIR